MTSAFEDIQVSCPKCGNVYLDKERESTNAELEALCRRFEITVANFGQSCAALRANEKAFQAWYAASVIQEFGLARVYREVHLRKDQLSFESKTTSFGSELKDGHELFPDLAVSWEPTIDARHTSARKKEVRDAASMLSQIAIITELKVTGSTLKHTPHADIERDLAKLMIFHRTLLILDQAERSRGLGCYFIILDNAPGDNDAGFKNHYSTKGLGKTLRLEEVLEEVRTLWDSSVPLPTVMLIEPMKLGARTHVFRGLRGNPETI